MSRILEAYVDETEIVIGGRKCLIYGAAIPHDLSAALDGLTELKARYGLEPSLEIKWSSKGGDPELKAALKEEVITLVGRLFTCLFVVWASVDRDDAFVRLASLVRTRAREEGLPYFHLLFDHDACRSRPNIVATLASWTRPTCTLFADAESRLSPLLQFADLALGAYSYLVRCQLGLVRPKTTIFEWEPGHSEPLGLDQVFGVLLRWVIPGTTPRLDPEAESFLQEAFMKDCVGSGVIIDERFSAEEMAAIADASTFYVGCMS